MGIQISQHINNTPLMREIADYFKPGLNLIALSKDSIQISFGGQKN